MTDISINVRKLSKFNPVVTLDNEDIYSQKDLDEEREQTIDRVLGIVNNKEHQANTSAIGGIDAEMFILGWVSCAKEIRWAVTALRGEE